MIMPGLWTDAWFYVSALGLGVSLALFFALLSQYRAAADAADRAEDGASDTRPDASSQTQAEGTSAIEPVVSSSRAPEVRPLASVRAPATDEDTQSVTPLDSPGEPAEGSGPAATPPPPPLPAAMAAPAESGVNPSPAAAYLRGLKSELDSLHQDVRALARRLDESDSRGEAVLSRLADIAAMLTRLEPPGSAPALPAPSRERDTVKELPHDFDQKLHNGVSDAIDNHFSEAAAAVAEAESGAKPTEAAPEAASPPQPADDGKPRRAPVWPV